MSRANGHLFGLIGTVVLIFIIIFFIFLIGLPKTQQCEPPTVLSGERCCLDDNSNSICDDSESAAPKKSQPVPNPPPAVKTNPPEITPIGSLTSVQVIRVLNGDTIEIQGGMIIALIGIDAPEKGEFGSYHATNRLRELVEKKTIQLEVDFEERTNRGLLRHIFIDGENVNVRMLLEGHSKLDQTTRKYTDRFRDAQEQAQREKIGIWTSQSDREAIACDERCFGVSYINYESTYRDDCAYPNDEFVTFENNCGHICDLTAWTIRDEGVNKFTFSDFSLRNGERVTVFSGKGDNSNEYLFWNNQAGMCKAVWDNTGDTIFLRNQDGELVLTYKYAGRILS